MVCKCFIVEYKQIDMCYYGVASLPPAAYSIILHKHKTRI